MAILFAVPKGTPPAVCKAPSCRKAIYWILTGSGKRMPIDVNVPDGKPPTKMLPGQGVPHWATCPEAQSFRKAAAR
jgi:hypothetical protein